MTLQCEPGQHGALARFGQRLSNAALFVACLQIVPACGGIDARKLDDDNVAEGGASGDGGSGGSVNVPANGGAGGPAAGAGGTSGQGELKPEVILAKSG